MRARPDPDAYEPLVGQYAFLSLEVLIGCVRGVQPSLKAYISDIAAALVKSGTRRAESPSASQSGEVVAKKRPATRQTARTGSQF